METRFKLRATVVNFIASKMITVELVLNIVFRFRERCGLFYIDSAQWYVGDLVIVFVGQ